MAVTEPTENEMLKMLKKFNPQSEVANNENRIRMVLKQGADVAFKGEEVVLCYCEHDNDYLIFLSLTERSDSIMKFSFV